MNFPPFSHCVQQVGLALGLLLLNASAARAQAETVKVLRQGTAGVVEEYSVLKSDESIRQGAYIRYRPLGGRAGVAVLEAGRYERGLREGEWRSFYEEYPWNKLRSKGAYHAGLPEGWWQYYHCFWLRNGGNTEGTNGRKTKAGFLVSLDDTTVVLQAEGLNHRGTRVGTWTYYGIDNAVIQQVNQATGQLVYWRPGAPAPLRGPALAATHPLLYEGGKTNLLETIHHSLSFEQLDAPPAGSAEFVFHVDSTGHQTQVDLATNVLPNPFEAAMLAHLNRLTTYWLPQVVAGRPVAASYPVKIEVTRQDQDHATLYVTALGD